MPIITNHKCKKNLNTPGAKYQDKRYGKGNRIVNEGKSDYRCTVCGEEILHHMARIIK